MWALSKSSKSYLQIVVLNNPLNRNVTTVKTYFTKVPRWTLGGHVVSSVKFPRFLIRERTVTLKRVIQKIILY